MDKKFLLFNVGIKDHLYQIWLNIVFLGVLILLPIHSYYVYGRENIGFAVNFSLYAFLIFFLLHLIFHLRYYFLSKNISISFDLNKNILNYKKGIENFNFSLKDIETIETNITKGRTTIPLFPWDNYCYSNIYLKNGKILFISSLVIPELIWPINMPKEKIKVRFFCWL